MSIPSSRGMISRNSCLQLDTRNSLGTSGHVFGLTARGAPSSALFENSKNLASRSCRLKPIYTGKIAEQRAGLRKEPQDYTRPTSRFARKFSTWNPLHREGGTYSQNCMMENPRNQISDLHFDKFPDSADVQCWKTNFKTEVSSNIGSPTIGMLWTKEVAKPVDDLMTSHSMRGRDFPDFEIFDAKIASALKRMMQPALDLSDLFNVSLQQKPASDVPKENVLECLYKM